MWWTWYSFIIISLTKIYYPFKTEQFLFSLEKVTEDTTEITEEIVTNKTEEQITKDDKDSQEGESEQMEK